MVHVVVLSVSVVAIFIAVMTSVGWDFGQVYRALEPQGTFKLIGGSRSNSYIIGTLAIQPFVTVVNALSISAAIGAKDAKTAQKAQSIMPIFAIFFFGLVIIAACCGKFLWPDMDPGDCLVHHCRSLRSRHGGAGQVRRAGGQYVYGADLHHGNDQYCNGALYSPA